MNPLLAAYLRRLVPDGRLDLPKTGQRRDMTSGIMTMIFAKTEHISSHLCVYKFYLTYSLYHLRPILSSCKDRLLVAKLGFVQTASEHLRCPRVINIPYHYPLRRYILTRIMRLEILQGVQMLGRNLLSVHVIGVHSQNSTVTPDSHLPWRCGHLFSRYPLRRFMAANIAVGIRCEHVKHVRLRHQ